MKVLIVDPKSEVQSFLANRISSLSPKDLDEMDITVNISGLEKYQSFVKDSDVLLIGPNVEQHKQEIINIAKDLQPEIAIFLFLSDSDYSEDSLRDLNLEKVKKVLPLGCSNLDLLQEFVFIHHRLCSLGIVNIGKIFVVNHAKGSVGATTFAGGLAEVCSTHNLKTLVWDLDIESRDISHSLGAVTQNGDIVSKWIRGEKELNRRTFREAICEVGPNLSVLMPPQEMASALDFIGNPEFLNIVEKIAHYAKAMFDVVIVDAAGRLSTATGYLTKTCDNNFILADDSVLGIVALSTFMNSFNSLLDQEEEHYLLTSGCQMNAQQIIDTIEPEHNHLNTSLPSIEFDPSAEKWPASGHTLYHLGFDRNKETFVNIAKALGLVDFRSGEFPAEENPSFEKEIKQRLATGRKHGIKDMLTHIPSRIMNFSSNWR